MKLMEAFPSCFIKTDLKTPNEIDGVLIRHFAAWVMFDMFIILTMLHITSSCTIFINEQHHPAF